MGRFLRHSVLAELLARITVLRKIDAAYCYRPSRVVCLSVDLSH